MTTKFIASSHKRTDWINEVTVLSTVIERYRDGEDEPDDSITLFTELTSDTVSSSSSYQRWNGQAIPGGNDAVVVQCGNIDKAQITQLHLDYVKRVLALLNAQVEPTDNSHSSDLSPTSASDKAEQVYVDYGMNDLFQAELDYDRRAWERRNDIGYDDTEGYCWSIKRSGLHSALRLHILAPGRNCSIDISSHADGVSRAMELVKNMPSQEASILKRWRAFNEEAASVAASSEVAA